MTIEHLRASAARRPPACENHAMQPTPDEIRAALERVLASDPFATTSRLSRFLRFVVERSLAGEGDRLKEYVIGVEVFDRDERYDPRVDSIVRVEAGRLRTKLKEYYRGSGSADPVVIKLQKGGYAPEFGRRQVAIAVVASPTPVPATASVSQEPASGLDARSGRSARLRSAPRLAAAAGIVVAFAVAATAWRFAQRPSDGRSRPVVAVLPFTTYADSGDVRTLAARLTDGVTAALVRIDRFAVVSSTSARALADVRGPASDVARALHADLLLQGQVVEQDGAVQVNAILIDGAHDRKIWVDRVSGDSNDVDDLARRVAASAAAAPLRDPPP
jgi:TolB-like protein